MSITFNGRPVIACKLNNQPLGAVYYNGAKVWTSLFSVTVSIDYYGYDNTATITLDTASILPDGNNLKIVVIYATQGIHTEEVKYVSKNTPIVTANKGSAYAVVYVGVYNMSNVLVGTIHFEAGGSLSETVNAELYT
jgi:hypothetical protein